MKKVMGFTLIELMVVISMLGILASIVVPAILYEDSALNKNECQVIIGDAEYITSHDHCEALRLYIESTIVR